MEKIITIKIKSNSEFTFYTQDVLKIVSEMVNNVGGIKEISITEK